MRDAEDPSSEGEEQIDDELIQSIFHKESTEKSNLQNKIEMI